ncbi:hypothetical protein GCM10025867_50170 (plasmid) [Frondihabitans sucicola]|uniref:Uncharacterized protein n=1 Tax=Frondihabitans sucicola TaxID=1268041 RepID=A0ABM8GWA9_9MICO|nr:hypothetical protein [Frondihabitans sucicola]BDZ52776.1 hypothetical protein GCM10025867_50170 [Frondihabitans sucicola]
MTSSATASNDTAEITVVHDVEGDAMRVGSIFYYPTLGNMRLTAIVQTGEDRGRILGTSVHRGESPDDDMPMIPGRALRSNR